MKTIVKPSINLALRDEWLRTIQALEDEIRAWVSDEPGWTVTESETGPIWEEAMGEYTAPLLAIHSPDGEVRVEPIARNFPGQGIVEMYAWPTAFRVRLIAVNDEEWRVLTDSGIYLRQPWAREPFLTLARDLVGAEAMTAAA